MTTPERPKIATVDDVAGADLADPEANRPSAVPAGEPSAVPTERARRRTYDRVSRWLIVGALFAATLFVPPRLALVAWRVPAGAVVVLAAVAAAAGAIARRRLWPLYLAALAGWLGFMAWPAVAVASYYTATRVRSRAKVLGYALASALLLGTLLLIRNYPDDADEPLLATAFLVGLPLAIGSLVAARRRPVVTGQAEPTGEPTSRHRVGEVPPGRAGEEGEEGEEGFASISPRTVRYLGRANRAVEATIPWLLAAIAAAQLTAETRAHPFAQISDDGRPTAGQIALAVAGHAVGILAAVSVSMARRRRWPLYTVGLLAWPWAGLGILPAIASYYTATSARRRGAITGYALVASAMVISEEAVTGWLRGSAVTRRGLAGGAFAGIGTAALMVGLPLAVGAWVHARRQVMEYQRERVERLERERVAYVAKARAQERTRIAREMHDVVAHRVALMVLHAGALEVNATDPGTVEAASLIRTTGREALRELRTVLGVLRSTDPDGRGHLAIGDGGRGRAADAESAGDGKRDERCSSADRVPQPTLTDLGLLVSRANAAGLPVHLIDTAVPDATTAPGPNPDPAAVPPAPVAVPAMVQRTAYRVVQEALTNVAKHAGGAETTVELRHHPDRLEVVVTNAALAEPGPEPGADPGHQEPGAGARRQLSLPGSELGLVGLRERVELAGGEFRAGPRTGGGFTVEASLPLTGDRWEAP